MEFVRKAIALSHTFIILIVVAIAFTCHNEWQEVEALEVGNRHIDEFRKEVNRIHIQLIEFSLLGETALDWDETDLENYHAQRIALDSTLCLFNETHVIGRIDSVRSLLEDKERQMFQIVRLIDEQQSINKKIASVKYLSLFRQVCRNSPRNRNEKGSWAYSAKKRKRSRRQQQLRFVHPIEAWSVNRKSKAVDCRNKPTVLPPAMQILTGS